MTYEELKKKLEELREKKRRLKQLEMQIAEEQASIDGIRVAGFNKLSVKGSGVGEPVQQRYIEHMERLYSDRDFVLAELFALEDYLSEHINELSPIEQNMLTDRYMNGKSWRKIQEEYGYEEDRPYKIVRKALEKICEKVKENSKK